MKKKLLSILLAMVLLTALLVPAASAASASLVAMNPLGDVDIQTNLPLTARDRFYDADGNLNLSGKRIGLSSYSKSRNSNAMTALGQLLTERFPGVTVVNTTALGSPWNNKTDANYNTWASLDAVIFGVAD